MSDAPKDSRAVGIVGLGRMGSVMAATLRETHAVLGWDIRDLSSPPAEMVSAAVELVPRCSVILLSLPSPQAIRDVLSDPDFAAAFADSACVVADTSTTAPQPHRELMSELGAAGARLLDAPILGRPGTCGQWTIPVGGDPAALERARPVLDGLADRVIHVGEAGSAHTIKLLNNMMFAAINAITAEAVGACERLQIPPEQFVDIVAGSSAATVSPLFRALAPRMLGESLEPVFTTRLLHKDLQQAVTMCEAADVPLIVSRALQIVTSRALEAGLGEQDSAALVEIYRTRKVGAPEQ